MTQLKKAVKQSSISRFFQVASVVKEDRVETSSKESNKSGEKVTEAESGPEQINEPAISATPVTPKGVHKPSTDENTLISKVDTPTTEIPVVKPAAKKTSAKQPKEKAPPKEKSTQRQKAKPIKRKSDENGTVKKKKALTPLEKQILQLKEDHPDKLLIVQIGYKYKMFGKDAQIGSEILNIMFISGDDEGDKGDKFSYCSFPDFKLHINLKRILNFGHKVGVVKQAESSIVKSVEKGPGSSDLMKRELTGVYTKGTYMSDEIDDTKGVGSEESPDYIISILENGKTFSLVAVQPITGEIIHDSFLDNIDSSELETRLLYLNPSEVIVINNSDSISTQTQKVVKTVNPEALVLHKRKRDVLEVSKELEQFFVEIDSMGKYKHLGDYYIVNFDQPTQACVFELISYLSEFKLSNIFTIPENIKPFTNSKEYLIMPSNTLYALEIFKNSTDPNSNKGSLVWLLDHTRTKFGKRMLVQWISKPLIERRMIEERHQAIDDMTNGFIQVVDSYKVFLDKIGRSVDLEELLIKAHYSACYKSAKISRREVYVMLDYFNEIVQSTKKYDTLINTLSLKSPLLLSLFKDLQELSTWDIASNFKNMMNLSFILNEFKDVEDQKTHFFNLGYRNWESVSREFNKISELEDLLEVELGEVRKLLKRPQLNYITNNKEPYLIEVRNGKQVDELPSSFHRINGTTTVSRFRTSESARLYKLIQYHKEMLVISCDEAYNQFLSEIDENYAYFAKLIKILSTLDCLLSLAAASGIGASTVKPLLVDDQIIEIVQGRNPIIENLPHVSHYVANNIDISYDAKRVLIITGPNMGGKSSYVKQVALTVVMSQIGCFIPCESAKLGIFDSVFIRMGAQDDILKGNSTFMTEMLECSSIINNISDKSLIILDEIGRGTGTTDGIAIAHSILTYLIESEKLPLVLFITHYSSLHVLQDSYPKSVVNYHMGFEQIYKKEQEFPEVIFLYSLVQGVVNNSYGLNVAKLAELPSSIISKAFEVSENMKAQVETRAAYRFASKLLDIVQDKDDADRIIQLEELLSYI